MARVAWAEIDGWGIVRGEHEVTGLATIGDDLLIPAAQTPSWGGGDVGLRVQLRRVDGTTRQDARGVYLGLSGTNRLVRLLPGSGVPLTTGNTWVWLEDHYRICDSIPPWWPPAAPIDRWIPALGAMTRVLSDVLPEGGGVGAAQSMRLSVLYTDTPDPRLTLLSRTWDVPAARLGAYLPAVASGLLQQVANIVPADGALLGRVVQIGTEALYVADDEPLAEVLRGVLRTQPTDHPTGSPIHDGLASGIGQVLRVYVADDGAESLADAREVFVGVIDSAAYLDDMATLELQCVSLLGLSHQWSASQRVRMGVESARRRLPSEAERDAVEAVWPTAPLIDFAAPRARERTFFRASGPVPEDHRWVILGDRLAYQLIEIDRSEEDQGDGLSRWESTFIIRGDELFASGPTNYGNRSCVLTTDATVILDDVPEYVPFDQSNLRTVRASTGSGSLLRIDGGSRFINLPERMMVSGDSGDEVDNAVANARDGAVFGWVFGPPIVTPQVIDFDDWWARAGQLYSPARRHVAEILLEVLTSTGTGRNAIPRAPGDIPYPDSWFGGIAGNFDRLPASLALGIPSDLIDIESFYLWSLRNPNAFAYELWLSQEDSDSLAEWMTEHILSPFGLALVSIDGARIGLVDAELLTDGQDFDEVPQIVSDDVWTDSPAIPRNGYTTGPVVLAAGAVLTQSDVWQLRADDRPRRVRVVSGTERFGLSVPLARVARETRTVDVSRGQIDELGWTERMRLWLTAQRGMTSVVTLEMREETAPRIGDRRVLVGIPVYPGTDGQRSLSGLAQCVARDVDLTTGLAVVRFRVSWIVEIQPRERWAPGAAVLSASSGTSVTVAESAFVPLDYLDASPLVTRIRSDREALVVGSRVILVDSLYELRDAGPAVVTAVDTGTGVVTLDPGFSETPDNGDVILLADASVQPAQVQLEWAFDGEGVRWR
jgi:hypothetical protein